MSRTVSSEAGSFRLRAGFTFALLFVAAGGLLARAVYLQLVNPQFFIKEGDARSVRDVAIDVGRATIYDRDGDPLAISTPEESAWADPQELHDVSDRWEELAHVLHRDPDEFKQLIARSQNRDFLWLARHLTPKQAQVVRDLDVPGVYFRQEWARYYPEAEVTGHVLGVTNIDDQGLEGVELAWDSQLAGRPGEKRVKQDRKGRAVEDVESIKAALPGQDLTLSLDSRIQYIAYRELLRAVEANHAASGSVVVIDVTTGEILAMVDQPAFNPNDRSQRDAKMSRNRAVTDYLEPGSSIKPFVIAAALQSGRFNASSVIDTTPVLVGNKLISDEHALGPLTLAGVLAKSSNVGMTKIARELEPRQIWTTLTQFGFGRVTASRFPGESAGVLSSYTGWRDVKISSLSRGYGIAVTPLQLAHAYATIGALGVSRPVSLERVDHPVQGERVISERNARTLISLLEAVVTEGTGKKASIPGYRVAGKTGTAKKNADHVYYQDRYTSVFGGLAPASSPRLAAVVVIDDPEAGRYYGADVAAPVFSAVVGGALRLMGVAPDITSGSALDPVAGVSTMVSR